MKGFSVNQGIRIVNMCSWNMKTAPGEGGGKKCHECTNEERMNDAYFLNSEL